VPALDVTSCGISGQEAVLDADELSGVRKLRAELKSVEPEAAANRPGAHQGPASKELLKTCNDGASAGLLVLRTGIPS
jgi:hypothetical protein